MFVFLNCIFVNIWIYCLFLLLCAPVKLIQFPEKTQGLKTPFIQQHTDKPRAYKGEKCHGLHVLYLYLDYNLLRDPSENREH